MEEKNYDIVPVLEQTTYLIKDYDAIKQACEEFITRNTEDLNLEDLSYESYEEVKKVRTVIRKKQEQVKNVRISCNEMALATFNSQAKELETILKNADDKLKEYVDTYDKEIRGKAEKPKIITLTIKGYDLKKIEKVKEYALKQGLEATIK